MSHDLVVSGDTYEGVERVAATNTEGGLVVYGDGEDISPTIAVSAIDGGHRITVTDAAGSRSFDVLNGASPILSISFVPFSATGTSGYTLKIKSVTKDPETGKETTTNQQFKILNGKDGLHGTDVALDIVRQDGDDPGWWFNKKQTVYKADGTTTVTETTDFLPLSGNAVLYTEQALTDEQKAQARENIKVLGRGDIVFTDGIGIEMVPGKPPVWTQSVVITAKSYDFDGTPILNEDGTQAEEEYTIDVTDLYTRAMIWGFEGTRAEFFDALAKNMKSLKADGLEVDEDEGSLFLLSGGERIGDPVPLGTGPQGPPGESGVTAPVNGFFTLSVDSDGNLWAHSAESGTTPDFEYDSTTGNLYFVTEE